MKNVVVAGATGLVGSAVVAQLEARADVQVHALVRQPGSLPGTRRREVAFDFRTDAAKLGGEIPCDVLISCLGTTIRKTGSPAAFRAVDHELPELLIGRLRQLDPKAGFAMVSSVGASARGNFYLRTKRETEELLIGSGLPYLIVRPSVLDGARGESRPLEHASLALLRPLAGALGALTGRSWRALGLYQPIAGEQVARTLIRYAIDHTPANEVREGWDLYDPV